MADTTKDAGAGRRAQLEARFKANEAKRQEQRDRKRADADEAADPAENAARFWAAFNADVEAVKADIAATVKAARSMGDAVKRREMPPKVDAWAASLKDLEERSSSATLFLAMYDVRQAQAATSSVRGALDEARAEILPRKKFTFRRRKKAAAAGEAGEKAAGDAGAGAGAAESKAAVEDSCAKFEVPEKSFERQSGKTLVVRPGELGGGVDFRLTRLEDCVIYLCDVTRALHVDSLKRCTVYTGPIAGSVLMEACEDCTFVFASRQIRLHTSHRCDFYLHVLSRPIIEHCDQLRFTYSTFSYPELAAQLVTAELDKERAATMWQNVDDFGWHRTQHSPNWSVLADADHMLCLKNADDEAVKAIGPVLNVPAAATEAAAARKAATEAAAAVPVAAAADGGDEESDDEL